MPAPPIADMSSSIPPPPPLPGMGVPGGIPVPPPPMAMAVPVRVPSFIKPKKKYNNVNQMKRANWTKVCVWMVACWVELKIFKKQSLHQTN